MKVKLEVEVEISKPEDIYDLLNKAIRDCFPIAASCKVPTRMCGDAIMGAAVSNIFALMKKPTKTELVDMLTKHFNILERTVRKR